MYLFTLPLSSVSSSYCCHLKTLRWLPNCSPCHCLFLNPASSNFRLVFLEPIFVHAISFRENLHVLSLQSQHHFLIPTHLRSDPSQFLPFYPPSLPLKILFLRQSRLFSIVWNQWTLPHLSVSAQVIPFELAFPHPNLFRPTQMSFPSWRFADSSPLPHISLPVTRCVCYSIQHILVYLYLSLLPILLYTLGRGNMLSSCLNIPQQLA